MIRSDIYQANAKQPATILVCGSRRWNDYIRIARALKKLPKDSLIVGRGRKGAFRWAIAIAPVLGLKVVEYLPDWERYATEAGSSCNELIFAEHKIACALVFHKKVKSSCATKHYISLLEDNNVPYILYN